jgi:hypothetical protein
MGQPSKGGSMGNDGITETVNNYVAAQNCPDENSILRAFGMYNVAQRVFRMLQAIGNCMTAKPGQATGSAASGSGKRHTNVYGKDNEGVLTALQVMVDLDAKKQLRTEISSSDASQRTTDEALAVLQIEVAKRQTHSRPAFGKASASTSKGADKAADMAKAFDKPTSLVLVLAQAQRHDKGVPLTSSFVHDNKVATVIASAYASARATIVSVEAKTRSDAAKAVEDAKEAKAAEAKAVEDAKEAKAAEVEAAKVAEVEAARAEMDVDVVQQHDTRPTIQQVGKRPLSGDENSHPNTDNTSQRKSIRKGRGENAFRRTGAQ